MDYRAIARKKLNDRWMVSALAYLLYSLITGALAFIPGIGSFASAILIGPLSVGLTIYFIKLHKEERPGVSTIFEGFEDFAGSIAVYLLTTIFTILWTLLFIIPGIIKAYAYSMSFYLKAKKPELSASESITLSSDIMRGKKLKLFFLEISFLGWALLSILTLGIGLFFLVPYMQAATTAFFEDAYNEYMGVTETVELGSENVVVTPTVQPQPEQKTETREEQVSKILSASNIKNLSDYYDDNDKK